MKEDLERVQRARSRLESLAKITGGDTSSLSSKQWGELASGFARAAAYMGGLSALGALARNGPLVAAASAAAGAALFAQHLATEKAADVAKVEAASRAEAARESARIADQSRIDDMIREYDGGWDQLDRGMTSRGDLRDRIRAASHMA